MHVAVGLLALSNGMAKGRASKIHTCTVHLNSHICANHTFNSQRVKQCQMTPVVWGRPSSSSGLTKEFVHVFPTHPSNMFYRLPHSSKVLHSRLVPPHKHTKHVLPRYRHCHIQGHVFISKQPGAGRKELRQGGLLTKET